jgi:hypothetical protein
MRRYVTSVLVLVALGMFVPQLLHAQTALTRISAQFRRWDGSEDQTNVAPSAGGTTIYTTSKFVACGTGFGACTAYVTFTATGDTHSTSVAGNTMQLLCVKDGVPCQSGKSDSSGVPGWLIVQNPNSADLHDNNVQHQWCTTVSNNATHTFAIKLGSTNGVDSVFLEGEHIFIDVNHLPAVCGRSSTP